MSSLEKSDGCHIYTLSPCGDYVIMITDSSVLLYRLFPSIELIHEFGYFPRFPIDVSWTSNGKKIIFEFPKNIINYYPFNCLECDAKTFELLRNSSSFESSLPELSLPITKDLLKSGHYGFIKKQSKIKIYVYHESFNLFVDLKGVLEDASYTDLEIKGLQEYQDYPDYVYSPDNNFISGYMNGICIWKKNGELYRHITDFGNHFASHTFLWFNNSQIIFITKDDAPQNKVLYKISIYDIIKNTVIKSFKILGNPSSINLNICQKKSILVISFSSCLIKNTICLINLITGNKMKSIDGFVDNQIAVWASGGSALVYQDNKGHICLYDFLEEQKKNIMLLQLESFRQKKNKLKTPVKLPRLPHELWDLIYDEFSISMINFF